MIRDWLVERLLFMPQTEEQLLERIERSLAQADAGMCIDADEVIDELLAECD